MLSINKTLPFLTIFTPTYNRAFTLGRLYNSLIKQTCKDFIWMVIDDGSTDNTASLIETYQKERELNIHYIYKDNGGLYTGYNIAYEHIITELSVCVDSDDYMPFDAVELILKKWKHEGSEKYAGIIGLDFYTNSNQPIGGYFPENLKHCYFLHLYSKKIHIGDTKIVLRTSIMKNFIPLKGFEGEKYFNPIYLILQVCDQYPLLVLNQNLCFVDYEVGDNMSRNIYRQYVDSPRSFAKLRILEMGLSKSNVRNRFRSATHLVAERIISRQWSKILIKDHIFFTVFAILPGIILYLFIRFKTRKS